jgi:outer membrane protein OmpA-like peptidoglycan-associated protein
MKKVILILITFLSVNLVKSQEDTPSYWIGANAGLNLNFNNANFDGFPGYDCCSEGFGNSLGFSYYLGLLFKYEIQDNLKLDLRLNYRPFSGRFIENQKIGNTQVLDGAGNVQTVDAIVDISISPQMNLFGLDVGVDYSFFDNFSVLGGVSPNYIIQGNFSQVEKLVTPDNVIFAESETKERTRFDNEALPDLNNFQFQAYIGLAYSYQLKKDNLLNFEVKYYQSFMNVTSVDWKVNNLFAGISYQYPIYPKKEKQLLIDTVYQRDTINVIVYNKEKVGTKLIDSDRKKSEKEDDNTILRTITISEKYESSLLQQSKIDANLKLYGIDTDGTIQEEPTITIEEIESEQGFPILPYIFFGFDEYKLNSTDQNMLTSSQVETFDENKLNWDVFDVYKNTLNIFAKRIKENNQSIQLVGNRIISRQGVQNKEIIENRLNEIENYFVNTWGISKSKISRKLVDIDLKDAKKDDDLFKESSRVEITTNSVKLIEPVFLKDIVRSSNPPQVGMDAIIDATNPPINWNMKITQDNNQIRDYNGKDLKFTKIWNIEDEPMPKLEKNVKVTLYAKDEFGAEKEITKDLIIKQLTIKKKREELKDDKKLEKYSLIVFDYNSAELKESHLDVIKKVKESIKPNSIVTIAGYADRTGEVEYNKNLAMRRIQSIKRLLNVPAKEFIEIPYGNTVLLYDNETEVGRSLSRTVQIIIETPIK